MSTKKAVIGGLGALMLAVMSAPVQASLVSTFDNSAEGWTAFDPTNDWTGSWQGSGGNPGGYFEGIETNSLGGDGYFISPDSWDGDWTQYIGGTLTYDLKVFEGSASDYFIAADVQIFGGGNVVSWTSPQSLFSSTWATHQIQLDASTFGTTVANFNSILSNVTALYIRGELILGPERDGLDNVIVAAPQAGIPEPASMAVWSALGVSGAGFCWLRRRRRA